MRGQPVQLAEWEVVHRCRQLGIEPGTATYDTVSKMIRARALAGLPYGYWVMLEELSPDATQKIH